MMSLEQQTPYYDCVGVILDDITVQGRNVRNARLPWSGFLKQEGGTGTSALRTIRAMKSAGCTFPNDDYEDYTGLGTKDVEFEVEEEDPYTPEATEDNPEPSTIYRSRIAWVNPLVRGMVGKEVDGETRKKLGESMRGLIKMAKTPGGGGRSGGDNPDDGVPRDPVTGRKLF
jgi:hypothetical protein